MIINVIDESCPLKLDDSGQFVCPHYIDRVMVTRNNDGTFQVDCFDCHNEDLKDHEVENLINVFVDRQGGWDD